MEITIIKIGGSIITDKDSPFSIKEKILDNILEQITKSKRKCILIHGAGSFGHPLAMKYEIINGRNKKIDDQILGLCQTHKGVSKLNNIIVQKLLNMEIPCMSLQPSAIFLLDSKIQPNQINKIKFLLDLGIIPILYGDIVLNSSQNFTILSGDRIISLLCEFFKENTNENIEISEIIFCFDKDGLIVENIEEAKKFAEILGKNIVGKIKYKDLDKLQLKKFKNHIDITGNIHGKLKEIKKICDLGITVQLINGNKKNYLYNTLSNIAITGTTIIGEN